MNERQPEEVEHRELVENSQEFLRAAMAEQMPDALLTAAWDEFYRVYDVLIRRFAVARGVRGADVDDCVQDVWSEIAKRLVGFQITSEAGLRSWLFALVRSRATDMFRRRTRRPLAFLGDSLQEGLEPAGREPDPSTRYDDAWQEEVVCWSQYLNMLLAGPHPHAVPFLVQPFYRLGIIFFLQEL